MILSFLIKPAFFSSIENVFFFFKCQFFFGVHILNLAIFFRAPYVTQGIITFILNSFFSQKKNPVYSFHFEIRNKNNKNRLNLDLKFFCFTFFMVSDFFFVSKIEQQRRNLLTKLTEEGCFFVAYYMIHTHTHTHYAHAISFFGLVIIFIIIIITNNWG